MGTDIAEIATDFLTALEAAATTGERDSVYPFLAPDVEWVTPQRSLFGLDAIREELTWGNPPDKLDLAFERGDLVAPRRGPRRLRRASDLHAQDDRRVRLHRLRRVELTVRDGKVSRYEMRSVG